MILPDPAPLGTVVARLRKDRGWSQAEFSRRVGYAPWTVCMWERGKQNIRAMAVHALAGVFNVELRIRPDGLWTAVPAKEGA